MARTQYDFRAEQEAYYRRRGPALADSVRRVLSSGRLTFVDYVALENVVLEEPEVLSRSPELQYQRLLLIAAAESARGRDSSTLARYWRASHEEQLMHSDFDAISFPRSKPFWILVDRHPKATWAEEAAWHAARLRSPADECYSECVLGSFVEGMYMQYWRRFPSGAHVEAAIDSAAKHVEYAVQLACYDRKGKESESYFSPSTARDIRLSLSAVSASKKTALLKLLEAGVAKCKTSP